MSDHLIRALVLDADVQALAVVATDTAREGVARHRCAASAGLILAEGLAAGLLLSRLQKEPRRFTLQVECDGPLRGLVVDADPSGGVRGFPRVPSVFFPSEHGPLLEPAFGKTLLVNGLQEIREGEWYRGSVEVTERSVAGAVSGYLAGSAQTDVAIDLCALSDGDGRPLAVAGVLFQRFPSGSRAALAAIRARLAEGWLAEWLGARAGAGESVTAFAVLDSVMGGEEGKGGDNLQILERSEVAFRCGCTRDRVLAALLTLDDADLEEMAAEGEDAVIHCDFCHERYEVSPDELSELRRRARQPDS